jgi:subtilase family serine protease
VGFRHHLQHHAAVDQDATAIDGTGQTIAIAGTSAIDIGEGDHQRGRRDQCQRVRRRTHLPRPSSICPQPTPGTTPIQISGNSQPFRFAPDLTGTQPCGIDDLLENSLDVEWSASVAKNAQIVLVASYPASSTDDNLYDSESYIVDNIGNSTPPFTAST